MKWQYSVWGDGCIHGWQNYKEKTSKEIIITKIRKGSEEL